jgi:hypothetical protein
MTSHAAKLVRNIGELTAHGAPWFHYTDDNFLPREVFADLVTFLPRAKLGLSGNQRRQRTARMPDSARALLNDTQVLDSIRRRFGFSGGRVQAEIAWFGAEGYAPHTDRADKLWNGQVYLDGDPKGTELYDSAGNLAKVVEWQPNRFTCWLPPGESKQHAAPESSGRFVLLWWILR